MLSLRTEVSFSSNETSRHALIIGAIHEVSHRFIVWSKTIDWANEVDVWSNLTVRGTDEISVGTQTFYKTKMTVGLRIAHWKEPKWVEFFWLEPASAGSTTDPFLSINGYEKSSPNKIFDTLGVEVPV